MAKSLEARTTDRNDRRCPWLCWPWPGPPRQILHSSCCALPGRRKVHRAPRETRLRSRQGVSIVAERAAAEVTATLPLRVLILSDLYPSHLSPQGGSFVIERIRALQAHGVEVSGLALRPRPTPVLRVLLRLMRRTMGQRTGHDLRDATFRLGVADYVRTTRRAPSARLLRRIADAVELASKGHEFDVIHAHGMYRAKAGIVAGEVSRRIGVPYVVTLHGSDVNTNMRRDPQAFIAALRMSSSTIYVSRALRDVAVSLGAPKENSHVIPNGVDVDLFVPGEKNLDSPVISFVGGLAEVKGADRLPAVFRGVAEQLPNARFEVVGRGHLEGHLKEDMADLPVTFRGHVDRRAVAEVMAQTSVLVVPSRSEGWGCVVIEAQAAGAVAVATRVGGLVESVGDERFLSPELEGAEGLVSRVVAALKHPPIGLRERAMTFRWDDLALREVERYEAAMEDAL